MLQDQIRTLSYKRAVEKAVKRSDVVLDMGCGTGILSFFAVKKGCRKVYAVDNSHIIDSAKEVAKRNGFDKGIRFEKKNIFSFRPMEKINVLIHEQIGDFIWDEDLVSKVAYVRDNFLGHKGKIIPFKIDLFFVPSSYRSRFNKSLLFWSKDQYGIDFSALRRRLLFQQLNQELRPYLIKLNDSKTFLATPKLAYSIDLRKEQQIPERIEASFKLRKNSRLRGVCLYIKVSLDATRSFLTKPAAKSTHWGQIFIPYLGEAAIKQDSVLRFTLFPGKKPENWKFIFKLNREAS
jgi:type I protein arginine methyltransferase